MSLIRDQSVFLMHVAELINKATEMGFQVTGGELYRTSEQQALHIKNGRSKTMNSQHLKRLAVDLNFFKTASDGSLKLTYEVEELRPIGQWWEGLDPANRWGGNWSSFKDTPHFERREGQLGIVAPGGAAAPGQSPARAADSAGPVGAAVPAGTRRGAALTITGAVGQRWRNERDDVETVQRLLNLSAAANRFQIDEGALNPDGAFGRKTADAIMAFQRSVGGDPTPSGVVEPNSETLANLLEALPDRVDANVLALIFLRASEKDVQDLCDGILRTMANRGIDTPRRQAHFLAQIGHESGELRFREEIASGAAYEGRTDLGNVNSGDGRRFKGRGLIQLTGRANYREYARSINRETEIMNDPEQIASQTDLCVDVAGWYWTRRKLSALADVDDLTTITKRINGGLNGLEDRRRLLVRAKALLGA